jgi:coenzyme PQQ synthesis protein D (PqqD)
MNPSINTGATAPRYVARSTEIAARLLGGEMMIMSARDSTLFSLNEVASVIWQAADGVTPLADIVEARVCAEFEVESAVALRDAEELVEELAQHGILHVSSTPINNTPIEVAP